MKKKNISYQEAGQNLLKFSQKVLPLAPQSFLYRMLRKKNIVLNEKKASGKETLEEGDEITFFLSDTTISKFQHLSVNVTSFDIKRNKEKESGIFNDFKSYIIYEDLELLVFNKPPGVLVQKSQEKDFALNEMLKQYLDDQTQFEDLHFSSQLTKNDRKKMLLEDEEKFVIQRSSGQFVENSKRNFILEADVSLNVSKNTFVPAFVHRLDRNTSGLLLAGKTLRALQTLSLWMKQQSLNKKYLCLVLGQWEVDCLFQAYWYKKENENLVCILKTEQKGYSPIQTAVKTISSNKSYTLLEVGLLTGRSHQIRAHLAFLGYPVVGDQKYGKLSSNTYFQKQYGLNRQFLHAYQVTFPQTKEVFSTCSQKTFQAKLPQDLQMILQKLKISLP
ncbi:pseudouridine synthase [Clostridia bacterium]|nr:pseudouridine synthase [Clostridia bacterium]